MLKLVIVAIILALVQCQSQEFSCLDGPPGGFFCSNDLTGYFDCNLDSNNQTQNIRKNCTLGTKCSCFINIRCKVPEAQICKTLPTPPTLSENFDYVYAQKIINQSPTAVTISNKKQRTIRNAGLKLVWGRTWNLDTGEQSFQVITPNGNNSFDVSFSNPFIFVLLCYHNAMETGRKLNFQKTPWTSSEHHMYVQFTSYVLGRTIDKQHGLNTFW